MARMKDKYVKEVAPALMTKFGYKSSMQIPKIEKEEKEISKKETEKEKNLWQKFTALFGF